jgi:hypothetical protein
MENSSGFKRARMASHHHLRKEYEPIIAWPTDSDKFGYRWVFGDAYLNTLPDRFSCPFACHAFFMARSLIRLRE